LDGCCDHRETFADDDLFQNAIENINRADALLFGWVTYEMMEAYWRPLALEWTESFARTIDAAKKYIVSTTAGPRRLERGARARRYRGRPFSNSSESRVRSCSWEA
jgi:hypothetical protein